MSDEVEADWPNVVEVPLPEWLGEGSVFSIPVATMRERMATFRVKQQMLLRAGMPWAEIMLGRGL